MKSRSRLEVVLLTALFVLAAACTKKKAFVDKVDDDGNGYIAKSALAGKEYFLSAGIEDSQADNQLYNATPGMNIDYGIVRAEITKDEIRFLEVFNPQNRKETADILAAYKITKHFDIQRERNDFGEETHKLIENTDKPWDQRAYIRVDWKEPVAKRSKLDFQTMYGVQDLAVENVDLVEDVTYKNGHLQFAVDASLVQPGAGAWGASKNARIKMRTHLVEVTKRDFVPLQYSERDFSRFGMFFTQQLFTDPLKGLRDSGVKHFAEKFNICKSGTGRACSTNVVKWYFTEGFPEEYKELSRKAVGEYNEVFKKILNRDKDVIILDESKQVNLTDPTVNTIAFYAPDQGGLGVRQNQVDPRTGEIISARVVIYGSGIDSIKGQVDDYVDMLVASGEGDSIGLGNGNDVEEKKGAVTGLKIGSLNAVEKLKARRSVLGLSNEGRVAKVDMVSKVNSVKQHIASERGNLDAKFNRMTNFAVSQRSSLSEIQKLKASGLEEIENSEEFVRSILKKGSALQQEKLRQNTPIKFANVQIEAQGLHSVEFMEDATLRFIERTLKEVGSVTKLSEQREIIKRKVATNVYYDTLLHEMGHAFGLRHNFAASSDSNNYTDEYKEKVNKIIKGDKSITFDDLHGSAYSSVMDYPSDFHLSDAGLGPYDKAALEYAYGDLSELTPAARNELLDASVKAKKPHPTVAPNFRFCTDDNAGEDLTCRRWDRGVNASMVTDHAIKSINSSYLMNHFRRERRNSFGLGRLIGRIFSSSLQIRQPMDEFLYQIITSPTGAGCGNGLLGQSIARGEMLDICTKPADAAKLGVDLNDMSTYHLALFNPDGTLVAKHPMNYVANGYADLLYASMLAANHFQDVLGAPEPGFYVAIDEGVARDEKTILAKLPPSASLEEALGAVAEERGEDPNEFVEKYGNRVLEMKPGRFARFLESTASGDQIHRKTERIGFFWDKYISMIVLGESNIGVQKYAEASMTANAYLLPQTQKLVHGLFEKLITTESKYLTQIPIVVAGKNPAGQAIQIQKMAQVPAASNSDIEAYSTLISLSSFSSQTDRSFSQSTRICLDNEPCLNATGLDWTKFVGANGVQYKAAQTLEKNSIAVAMLNNGAELNKKLKAVVAKIGKREGLKNQAVLKAQKVKADRSQSGLDKRLTDMVGDSKLADALAKSADEMIRIVQLTDDSTRAQMLQSFYTSRNALEEARADWVTKAIAKAQKAGEDVQKCQEAGEDGSPKIKCPVLEEVIKVYGEFAEAQGKLFEAPIEAFDLASLELEVDGIQRDTNSLESKIQFMRSVHDAVNRF